MNVEYQVENGKAVIYFYKRENGVRKVQKIKDFESYFYVSF